MDITKVEITNYRGFLGTHSIEFLPRKPQSSTIGQLHIVTARNTVGKSTFFNAISWCLFGEEMHLLSTRSKSGSLEPIVNTAVLRENKGKDVKVSVRLFLDCPDMQAQICREALGREVEVGIAKIHDEKLMCSYASVGSGSRDKSWTNKYGEDANFFIWQNILDKEIRQFFLIDGEKLRDFFLESTGKGLRDSIIKVTDVNYIKNSLTTINQISKEVGRNLRETEPNLTNAIDTVNQLQNALGSANLKKEELSGQIREGKVHLSEIMDKIKAANYAEYSQILSQKNEFEGDIKRLQSRIDQNNLDLDENIRKNAYAYILKKAYKQCISILEKHEGRGVVPPTISEPLRKYILDRRECICGTKFESDPSVEKLLKNYFDQSIYSPIEGKPLVGLGILPKIIESAEAYVTQKNKLLQEREENERDLKNKKSKHDDILDKLQKIGKAYSEEQVRELEKKRQKFDDAINESTRNLGAVDEQIRRYTKELEAAKLELEAEKKRDTRASFLKKQDTICRESLELLSDLEQKIEGMLREQLETRIRERFFSTGTREVVGDIGEISLNEAFEIDVKKKNGFSCLHSMSAGQSLVFTLAVATALRELSRYKFPLVIDTPTAKLDEENEKAVLTIPESYSEIQLILLLILGKEYTEKIRQAVKKTIDTEKLLVKDTVGGIKVIDTSSKRWDEIKKVAGA